MEAGRGETQHIAWKVGSYDCWRRCFVGKKEGVVFESETEDVVFGYRGCFYA